MRVLILQTGFLGDVILSTPLLPALHAAFPGVELWMMTTPYAQSLVRRDPLLSGVLVFDKRGRDAGVGGLRACAERLHGMGFDRAYALHRSWRSALLLSLAKIPLVTGFRDAPMSFLYHRTALRPEGTHDVLRRLSILAGDPVPAGVPDALRLHAPRSEECADEVRSVIANEQGYVLLVPGSEWETKRWAASGYRAVSEGLLSRGIRVVIGGSAVERAHNRAVSEGLPVTDLSGRTSLDEFMALVQHARLLVCNDSMALHMASAFGIPAVAVFCATSPAFGFGPWRNRAQVVEQGGLSCKPCRRHGSRSCPTGTRKCMQELEPRQVMHAIEALLSR